jgi:hypothetical protein
MEPAEARTVVRSLLAWGPVPVDPRTIEGAWRLEDRYSLAWWDALIVSAAQIAGPGACRRAAPPGPRGFKASAGDAGARRAA